MAMFNVNSHRLDPYKNFKFRVRWDGLVIAGVSKISSLKRTTENVPHRSGGDPSTFHLSPGATSFEPITLERGVTHDTAFEDWANLVFNLQGDGAMSLRDYKKDIIIDLLNLQGQVVLSYFVHRAWVSEYEPVAGLNANSHLEDTCVAIERLVLQHEGWERDTAVQEPAES